MPGNYGFNKEGQTFVLNFYRVDWQANHTFTVLINGGTPTTAGINYGTPQKIVFPPAPNPPGLSPYQQEGLTLIWDGTGAWSILHASNVNVFTA